MTSLRPLAALAGGASSAATAAAAIRTLAGGASGRTTTGIPFSSLFAGGFVGADWATRRAVAGEPAAGEIDDFSIYDRPGFDSSAVHPEIRRFYERTSTYALAYETTWHRGFRLGARLAALPTSRLQQLNLPGRSDGEPRRLESAIARLDPGVDGRPARVWTRTDPETGEAVFVAIYATHEREGVTYANVAAPLPGANLSTVLRPEVLEVGTPRGAAGVQFTTRGSGDGGLYLVTPLGAVALPMEQSFRVWPADGYGGPTPPTDGATLVATHEMWLYGRRFLTIAYGIERADSA